MTKGQTAYREFLNSKFWVELSAQRKVGVKRCERCRGKRFNLQSHHIRYPKDWYATKLTDLIVLCRRCHLKEHGFELVTRSSFMPYRKDEVFNAAAHRCHRLQNRLNGNLLDLRPRDEAFLRHLAKRFAEEPPILFQIQLIKKFQAMLHSGCLYEPLFPSLEQHR